MAAIVGVFGGRPPRVDKLKRRGDVPSLLRALEFERPGPDGTPVDRGADVRAEAAAALTGVEGAAVSKALVASLGDPDPTVRAAVIAAIVERGPSRAVDPLVDAAVSWAEPSRARARGEAVAALAAMRDSQVSLRVASALLTRRVPLEDPDLDVAERLARAPEGGPQPTVERLVAALADDATGDRAVALLVRLTPDSVEPLIAALGEPAQRERAARALGWSHDKRAVEPLCSLMVESPDPPVRRVAAWALGEIHDLAAVEALLLASDDADYDVRTEAGRAFDRFGNVGMALALTALVPPAPALPSGGEVEAEVAEGEPVEAEEETAPALPSPRREPPRFEVRGPDPAKEPALRRLLRRRPSL